MNYSGSDFWSIIIFIILAYLLFYKLINSRSTLLCLLCYLANVTGIHEHLNWAFILVVGAVKGGQTWAQSFKLHLVYYSALTDMLSCQKYKYKTLVQICVMYFVDLLCSVGLLFSINNMICKTASGCLLWIWQVCEHRHLQQFSADVWLFS